MKVIIRNVKGTDISLKCNTCNGEEFNTAIVLEKVVNEISTYSGSYREGYKDREINSYTCIDCGNTYYISDEYDSDIDSDRLQEIE